jgi:N utilization substance protein A
LEVPGIGEITVELLFMDGYRSAEEVAQASEEDLAQIDGIGPEKAKAMIRAAQQVVEQKSRIAADVEGGLSLDTLEGVGEKTVALLSESGIRSVEQLATCEPEALMNVPGIGPKKAEALLEAARQKLDVQAEQAAEE